MKTQAEQIAEHLKEMPTIYRATYKKAVTGKSLRAAVNSFCAECTMWQREEVRLCTSLACSLYPYRPYRCKPRKSDEPEISPKKASEEPDFAPELKNSEQ